MTDRELLEMAAKAAGFTFNNQYYDQDRGILVWTPPTNYESIEWNPLTDDGDALRLAVKLGLRVCIDNRSKFTWVKGAEGSTEHRNDASAATRRAIVRAAAEIGKAMP